MAIVKEIATLEWKDYSSDTSNLVCPVVADFGTVQEYNIVTSGNSPGIGNINRTADGVAIDNLQNAFGVTFSVGPLMEYVPPYSKSTLGLTQQFPLAKFTGDGVCLLTFYTGDYKGSVIGSNMLEAYKLAAIVTRTGVVDMWPGLPTAIPPGTLLCDGQQVNRSVYADLFAIIGIRYGAGDGVTTFNLPNFNRKMPVGADSSGTRNLAATGGAETVSLTTANLAAHNHPVTDPGHTHTATQTAHSHGVTDAGHSHAATQAAHNHGYTDPGHNHGINNPAHGHSVSDPGHAHNVYDPGHNTTIADSGHSHGLRYSTVAGSTKSYPTQLDNWGTTLSGIITNTETAYSGVVSLTNYTGIAIYGAGTGLTVVNGTTAISANASGVGITISNATPTITVPISTTGVVIQNATPAIAVVATTTGVTTQNTGTGSAHENMPPWLAMYFIIWTGQI